MEDTIYRQEALEGLYDVFFDDELSAAYPNEADKVLDVIRKLPSAEPERKKGMWIDNDKINFPQCSECGMWIDVMQQSGEMNYCPNCGADMRGESE